MPKQLMNQANCHLQQLVKKENFGTILTTSAHESFNLTLKQANKRFIDFSCERWFKILMYI